MSIFEFEGKATREVTCDIAIISIDFYSSGDKTYEVSKKVMEECDKFLLEIERVGIDIRNFRYEDDNVDENKYGDDDKICATRTLEIKIPFDMKVINLIQTTLQEGKYNFGINVSFDVSDIQTIKMELAKEALQNSRHEAEQLAEILGLQVKGVETITKDNWCNSTDRIFCKKRVAVDPNVLCRESPSDRISSKTMEETVFLKIKWILE